MNIWDKTFRVYSVTPAVKLQYKLVERDNGTAITIDRGVNSDMYESTFTIIGETADVEEVQLSINRNTHINISSINSDEAIFGDNVNYSGVISCVVIEISQLKQRLKGTSEITLTIRAERSNITFIGQAVLPQIKCVSTGYWTKTTLGQTINDSYTGINNISDSVKDVYECELQSVLNFDDAQKLQEWYRLQRGREFTMLEADWGVDKPFRDINQNGTKPQVGDYPYQARMLSLSIERFGVKHRKVTITLRKEGA
jgi:hypothetical protein